MFAISSAYVMKQIYKLVLIYLFKQNSEELCSLLLLENFPPYSGIHFVILKTQPLPPICP